MTAIRPTNKTLALGQSLRARIKSKAPIFGPWANIPHPNVVEILARRDFGFLMFDGEHSPVAANALGALLPSAELHDCASLFRCSSQAPGTIKQALDSGASGVMVPMIESVEQAQAVVAAARYAPAGRRGIGPWRASAYYDDQDAYFENANSATTILLQIESETGLAHCHEIAAVEGYDVLYVGPADLAGSLGVSGSEDDRMIEALETVARAGRANGKALGLDLPSLDMLPMLIGLGYSVFTFGSDYEFLTRAGDKTAAATYRASHACQDQDD